MAARYSSAETSRSKLTRLSGYDTVQRTLLAATAASNYKPVRHRLSTKPISLCDLDPDFDDSHRVRRMQSEFSTTLFFVILQQIL